MAHGLSLRASQGRNAWFRSYWFQTRLANYRGVKMKWVESKDVGGQLLVWVKAPNTDHWFLLREALSWYPTSLGETKMGKMQFLKVQSLSTLVCSWCFSWPVWEHTNHNLQFPPLQRFLLITLIFQGGFPGGSVVKNPPANAGDVGSVPRLGRCPGKGHGNPLQYSCLEIPWTEESGGLQAMGSQSQT